MELNLDMNIEIPNLRSRKYELIVSSMLIVVVILFLTGMYSYYNDSITLHEYTTRSQTFQKLGVEDRKQLHEEIDQLRERVHTLEEQLPFRVR